MVHRLRVHLRLRDGPPVLDMGCGRGTPLWRNRTEDDGRRRVPGDDPGAERKSDRVKWMQACRSLALSGRVLRRGDDGALCSSHAKYRESLCGRVLRSGRLVSALHRSRGAILAPGILPRALEAACRQMPPVFLLTARLKKAGFALFDVETFLVQPDLQDLFLCTAANIVPPLPRSRRARRHLHLRHPGRERGDPYRIGILGADIGSGRIDQVRDRFDSDQGDSLFSSRKRKTEEVGGFEPRVSRPARRVRLVSLGDFRSDVLRGRVTTSYFKNMICQCKMEV